MHGSNRLGGNSLSDLLVFGRRAGLGAAAYVDALGGARPAVDDDDVAGRREARSRRSRTRRARENPYTLHQELQQTMNDLVGIIRTRGRDRARRSRARDAQGARPSTSPSRATGSSTRAGTSRSTCATCCWSASASRKAALMRAGEPRRPHPRRLPGDGRRSGAASTWSAAGSTTATASPCRSSRCPRCATDLLALFERDELAKYLTDGGAGSRDASRGRAARQPTGTA